jgi:endonuclease/exonuclease/phosphatase family metal-dependent hydrolase
MITINTWGTGGPHQKRWNFLLKEIDRFQPNILFLQEVFGPELTMLIESHFGFQTAATYEAGLATLSSFSIDSTDTLKYGALSPFETCDRRALLTTLKIGGQLVLTGNTHLSWRPEDKQTRCGQINSLLSQVKLKEKPVILAGDFNDTPNSEPVSLLKKAGFIDLFGQTRPHKENITWDNRNPYVKAHSVVLPDRRIDLILANREFLKLHTVQECEIIFNKPDSEGIFPSDHYGVFTEMV